MSEVRVTIEAYSSERFSVRTNDLAGLRARLGENVLDRFLSVWLLSDRIISLYQFLGLAYESPESSTAKRHLLTFYAFLAGTLKELSLNLGDLRAALVQANLWDSTTWALELQAFERWGQDPINSRVRNELGFHVSSTTLSAGLDTLSASNTAYRLFEGESPAIGASWSRVSHESLLEALRLKDSDLEERIHSPGKLPAATAALEREFYRVLERVGIKPIKCLVRGEPSGA